MKTLDEIKQMMAAGDTAKAAEELKELLAKEPQNLQAKMLYGTCCQILGDEETFKRIHDELSSEMETREKSEPQSETVSLWKKYHALWLTLIAGGLVLACLTGGAYWFGKTIEAQFSVAAYRGPTMEEHSQVHAGPPRSGLEVHSGLEVDSSKRFSDSDGGFKP